MNATLRVFLLLVLAVAIVAMGLPPRTPGAALPGGCTQVGTTLSGNTLWECLPPTATPTATPTSTSTPTSTATRTPVPPTATASLTPTPTVWRPFSSTSPWNVPIAANAPIDPNSTAMLARMSAYDVRFWVNLTASAGVTIWQADSTTQRYFVHCRLGNCVDLSNAPIPNGAIGANSSDGHMVVIDMASHTSYEFYRPVKQADGSWNADWGTTYDLNGDGIKPRGQSSTTAAGFSLLAGLIRPDEMRAGRINHALLYSSDRPGTCLVWPASTNAGVSGPNSVPMGGRLQLDPALDLNMLPNITPAGKIIARALQEYGMYLGDGGAGISIYGESFYGKTDQWPGLLTENALVWVPLHAYMRVLALGPQDCVLP